MITNPMIMGAAVGAVFLWLGIRLPACVEKPVKEYAALCTPLACFVMGGTLQFSSIRKNLRYLVPTLTAKLVLVPAIIVAVSVLLGFSPLERFVLYSQFAGSGGGCLFLHGSGYGRRRGFGKRDGGGQLLCQRIYDFYVDLCD